MEWEPNAAEVGLIAAGVTLIGILITNQAKVSEFRQKWIDALRDDAATLITHTLILHSSDAEDDVNDSYLQIHQTSARIRLRLNPKENATTAVIAAMNKMRDANHQETEFAELNNRIDEFTVEIQSILKKEWWRVKWGEPLYRSVLLAAISGAALFLGIIAWQSFPLGMNVFLPPQ